MKMFLSEESVLRHNKRNRPLPSSKNPHFQNEDKCTTFLVKMSLMWYRGPGELANGVFASRLTWIVTWNGACLARYAWGEYATWNCRALYGRFFKLSGKKMDKLRLWSNKNKNDFPSNCRINTYLINLVWLISLKGRNRAYRTGWTNLQRALWWKNAWRTHGMNLLHCIEKCYALLIILYFISSITSVRFLSACFYFFVSLVWSSSDQVIKVKWCCFYWKAQWKPYNYWSLAGIFA